MTGQLKLMQRIKLFLLLLGILYLSSCALDSPKSRFKPSASGRQGRHATHHQLTACQNQKDMMEKARLFLKEKKYRGALKLVSDILREPCKHSDHYSQALEMAGDIFMLRGEFMHSIAFYTECMNSRIDRN